VKKKYDAVVTLGEYTDKATGQKVKRYLTIGVVFESDNGRLAMKLDALPVVPGWSGYISFRDAQPGRQATPGTPTAPEEIPENGQVENGPF
jgi:hypothetical protein